MMKTMTMAKPCSVLSRVAVLLALFLMAVMPAAAKPIDSIEDAINSAPMRDLKKLQATATATSALPEVNKFYSQHVVNQKAVIKAKVDMAAVSSPGRSDLKIRAVPTAVNPKGMSKPINVLNWFYFADGAPAPTNFAAGSDVTISGIIRRCEIVRTEDGTLRVNFDLVDSKVEK